MSKIAPVKLYFAKLYVTGVKRTGFSMYRKVAPLKGLLCDPSFFLKKGGGTNVLLFFSSISDNRVHERGNRESFIFLVT